MPLRQDDEEERQARLDQMLEDLHKAGTADAAGSPGSMRGHPVLAPKKQAKAAHAAAPRGRRKLKKQR
jgi:hypothetical protein